jgi:PKD repeat protein
MMGVGLHRRTRRPVLGAGIALGVAFALLFPPAAQAAPGAADFTWSPASPLTLETVTFNSTSTGNITSQAWDLDDDRVYDEGTDVTAARSFPTAGTYLVWLRVDGPEGGSFAYRPITVLNRPPTPSLTFFPAAPVAGELVNFVSTSKDADGTIINQLWDLDNDGAFDDGSGGLASTRFEQEGPHVVRLWTVDNNRAEQVATQTVTIAPKPLALLSSFPVVRMVGKATGTGVRISRFTVEAPIGARVEVRCRGGGCPRRGQVRKVHELKKHPRPTRLLRFRRFERRLKARAVVRIFITKPGAIGKYTSFRVRKGKAPKRRDLCMLPEAKLPSPCPGT